MFCHHPVRKLDNYWSDIILKRLYPVFHTLSCTDTSVTGTAMDYMNIRSQDEGGIYRWSQSKVGLNHL